MLVAAFGYRAETTRPSGDYGVDVVAVKGGRQVVVQCKLYGQGAVGGDAIMRLVGSRTFFGASDAICIATSRFTRQAREVAARQNVHLVDRAILSNLCRTKVVTIPSATALVTHDGRYVKIGTPTMRIGRSAHNDLVLSSPLVSRNHASLTREGIVLVLRDHSSTNGTFLNGERIRDTSPVSYGDQLSVGGVVFEVTMHVWRRSAQEQT